MHSPLIPRWLAIFLLAVGTFIFPARAQQENCWAPDYLQPVDPAIARSTPVAEWKKDFEIAGAVLKKNRTLQRIPQTRLRNRMFIGSRIEGIGHFARVTAMLYPPVAWAEGECGLRKGPDFFNSGHLDIIFNDPRLIFEHHAFAIRDLEAYFEPQAVARVGEETLYNHGKFWVVALTPNRLPPWIPVTVEEYLQFKEGEVQKKLAGLEKTLSEVLQTGEKLNASMAGIIELRKTDPALAEQMQKNMETERARWEKEKPEVEKQYQKLIQEQRQELSAMEAFKSGMLPAERNAQARLGDGRFGLAQGGTLDRGAVVRVNPALSQDEKSGRRIQLIVVKPFANNASLWDALGQAMRDVDYATLRQLLR